MRVVVDFDRCQSNAVCMGQLGDSLNLIYAQYSSSKTIMRVFYTDQRACCNMGITLIRDM